MANGAGESITPFFTIWTAPRETIRDIVDYHPTRNVIALAAIGPAIGALASQWSKALGNNANLSVLWPIWVVVAVAIQAALGVLLLFILGAVFKWSGSLLGGVASRIEMRAALAWSQVPAIAAEVFLLIAVLMGVPIPTLHATGTLPQIDPAFYKVMVVEGVLGFWGFIVSLKCIGEVHRFSAWRALAAVLIPPLIALVAIGFIVFLISRLMGHH
ncbi:MAG TPA: Yip1 family protein [Candidatus Binatus sp.]|uniref:Yip1 family protein n=1 Tax=Candidatus Binatus sp. TaxID=2811406 RepID=UPI002B4906BF|nr:Yip1 family protein [Candidatus Binatus sp.]HKN13207.1 Yip1 family protein [Candidatus Binatus sp.]